MGELARVERVARKKRVDQIGIAYIIHILS